LADNTVGESVLAGDYGATANRQQKIGSHAVDERRRRAVIDAADLHGCGTVVRVSGENRADDLEELRPAAHSGTVTRLTRTEWFGAPLPFRFALAETTIPR
jgi:hypothetical protein